MKWSIFFRKVKSTEELENLFLNILPRTQKGGNFQEKDLKCQNDGDDIRSCKRKRTAILKNQDSMEILHISITNIPWKFLFP